MFCLTTRNKMTRFTLAWSFAQILGRRWYRKLNHVPTYVNETNVSSYLLNIWIPCWMKTLPIFHCVVSDFVIIVFFRNEHSVRSCGLLDLHAHTRTCTLVEKHVHTCLACKGLPFHFSVILVVSWFKRSCSDLKVTGICPLLLSESITSFLFPQRTKT